jgi:hypothetical protein
MAQNEAAPRALWTIGDDLEALDALLSEVGGDVTEEAAEAAVEAWFAELREEESAKLDRYGRFLASLDTRAKLLRDEVRRCEAAARAEENKSKRLRDRLLAYLQASGETSRTSTLYRFTVARAGGAAGLDVDVPVEQLPERFRETVTTYKARSDAIRAALAAGEALPFARLRERGVYLKIT